MLVVEERILAWNSFSARPWSRCPFSGNVRLPVHPYERWGYFSRLERLWRASTRHACSHVPSRVARYVGIELSCDDESIVRRRSSTGEFAQELAGWCSFIVFNFWQQRLPGETTRKPRLPGRHWSVALGISRLEFGVPSS